MAQAPRESVEIPDRLICLTKKKTPWSPLRRGERADVPCRLGVRLPTYPAEEPPFRIKQRIPWTTSRLIRPLPYTVEKAFMNLRKRRRREGVLEL